METAIINGNGRGEAGFHARVLAVQAALRAPKGLENKFGGYVYRKAEDILAAAKPLAREQGLIITLDDDIRQVGERYYVCATARLADGEHEVSARAFAREQAEKKGMDAAQVTGAASSYARKYALQGLLAIDDSADDPDTKEPSPDKKEPSLDADAVARAIRSCRSRAEFVAAQKKFFRDWGKNGIVRQALIDTARVYPKPQPTPPPPPQTEDMPEDLQAIL